MFLAYRNKCFFFFFLFYKRKTCLLDKFTCLDAQSAGVGGATTGKLMMVAIVLLCLSCCFAFKVARCLSVSKNSGDACMTPSQPVTHTHPQSPCNGLARFHLHLRPTYTHPFDPSNSKAFPTAPEQQKKLELGTRGSMALYQSFHSLELDTSIQKVPRPSLRTRYGTRTTRGETELSSLRRRTERLSFDPDAPSIRWRDLLDSTREGRLLDYPIF